MSHIMYDIKFYYIYDYDIIIHIIAIYINNLSYIIYHIIKII